MVITNPTHYAVALKYDPEKGNAPVLLAKGSDFLALKIAANEILLLESPALARSIYYSPILSRKFLAGCIWRWRRCWLMSIRFASTARAKESGRSRLRMICRFRRI
ncbi:hypothetical protein EMIT0P258_130079 [Pseudomonas sp. IT-P258]